MAKKGRVLKKQRKTGMETHFLVNAYSLRHDVDNELLSDAIHMVFVELSKLKKILKKPVADMSERISSLILPPQKTGGNAREKRRLL